MQDIKPWKLTPETCVQMPLGEFDGRFRSVFESRNCPQTTATLECLAVHRVQPVSAFHICM